MVYIKEVFPNPAGNDAAGEWIKIINTGDSNVSLAGWSVLDASGKSFVFGDGASIAPQNELILPYQETKLTLNNGGDTIILKDAGGHAVDTLIYSSAVSSDELIIADRFIQSVEPQSEGNNSLKDLSFSKDGALFSRH